MHPANVVFRWASAEHAKSIALMKFLSAVARRLGVAEHIYVVGGAVRNFILQVPIKDIDVVVDSIALDGKDSAWFAQAVQDAMPVPSSLATNQYGVAILTVKGDWNLEGHDMSGEVIEIANARKESYAGAGGKGKGYKPEDVSPATIEEDVYRREFTFNSLLWRMLDLADGPDKAEIIDITGLGQKHLKEKLLQTPRDPDIVFGDDPTRILRLLKFQARYNLKIPSNVADSVRRNAQKMKNMPWEAIGTILVNDILSSPAARRALGIMVDLDIIPVIREMVLESKPFATFLARQLRENRNVQLLLDLADLGMSASTPVSFLSPKQVQRLREITITMDEADANRFVGLLQQPPIDNMALINEFQIPANQRKNLMFMAREALLDSPHLALFPERLTQEVRKRL